LRDAMDGCATFNFLRFVAFVTNLQKILEISIPRRFLFFATILQHTKSIKIRDEVQGKSTNSPSYYISI
jgi:hypothetical protein